MLFRSSLFDWLVGSDSWSEVQLSDARIEQIVEINGQFIAMDDSYKIHSLQLSPQLGLQKITTEWVGDLSPSSYSKPWLVVCGDMLLMVDISITTDAYQKFRNMVRHSTRIDRLNGFKGTFRVFRLDFSTIPTKWVKMEKLENLALFVSLDRRSPTFSCINPERWGGKSNHIYIPSASKDPNELWITVKLGQSMSSRSHPVLYSLTGKHSQLESLWVLPSLVYGVDQ